LLDPIFDLDNECIRRLERDVDRTEAREKEMMQGREEAWQALKDVDQEIANAKKGRDDVRDQLKAIKQETKMGGAILNPYELFDAA
jgi:chromosome segregation ATPase